MGIGQRLSLVGRVLDKTRKVGPMLRQAQDLGLIFTSCFSKVRGQGEADLPKAPNERHD